MKIGFIGLGNMGRPMASNLCKHGHILSGFDTAKVHVEGVRMCQDPISVARNAEIVITMLPNGEALRSIAKEIIPVMKTGTCFVDCSTVDVESSRTVAQTAEDAGLLPIDAPVSGGVTGAESGTLTFMVGGSAEAFRRVQSLFKIMGQKAVHCGPSGSGQVAKICNNMILGATMIVTCEALVLADRLGLECQKLFDVVSTSSGYSWSMNTYCPVSGVGPKSPADNNYIPGFAAELMLKDLGLSQQAAELVNADTPIGKLALNLYQDLVENQDGRGKDFSVMIKALETKNRA
ncbi:MAG: 3-hydroxyisobutyrate dehydrogenase [Aestuariivita sp.]|nr:3-hydroxyisobutyrate dehydrogenase [Aestuariivita sp.]